jgi:UDP-N-acetyl-D-mannosaminuronate dehydrogenase
LTAAGPLDREPEPSYSLTRSTLATKHVSLVLGLGEVGRPLLQVLSARHHVEGIDVPARDVEGCVDIMHVCYPAEIHDFVGVTRDYCRRYKPEIVVIHSTVPVGTTAAVEAAVAVPVVHSPVRGKHVRMAEELTHYVKFLGARDEMVAARLADYFAHAGMKTRILPSPEASELAKLTETTYFGVLIAFAQDVDRMARQVGVAYDDIAAFYEEIGYLPRTKFFPGVIGGHCVMPNIKLLKKSFTSKLLDAVEWSNDLRMQQH